MESQPAAGQYGGFTVADGRYDVLICGPADPNRVTLEGFISRSFQRNHGATVRSFMPTLIGLRNAAGKTVGAAGYRPAELERLFLEQYLDLPIEGAIEERYRGLTADRTQVAEIGNFACRDCTTATAMMAVLAQFLVERRHSWVAFTATRAVRSILRRLGVELTELARAERSRITTTSDNWGAYYKSDPRVMLGYMPRYRVSLQQTCNA